MSGRHAYLLTLVLSVASVSSAGAQEVLQPARIQAKASRRQPALGLPKRLDSQTDPVVWYVSGEWKGADSLKGVPFWTMAQVSEPAQGGELTQVLQLCAKWASEKPKRAVDIVWGPYSGGWFIAICKKTQSDLGWKSIGFVIPAEGILEGKPLCLALLGKKSDNHFISPSQPKGRSKGNISTNKVTRHTLSWRNNICKENN